MILLCCAPLSCLEHFGVANTLSSCQTLIPTHMVNITLVKLPTHWRPRFGMCILQYLWTASHETLARLYWTPKHTFLKYTMSWGRKGAVGSVATPSGKGWCTSLGGRMASYQTSPTPSSFSSFWLFALYKLMELFGFVLLNHRVCKKCFLG